MYHSSTHQTCILIHTYVASIVFYCALYVCVYLSIVDLAKQYITVIPSMSSAVTVKCLPQGSSNVSVIKSCNVEYTQCNFSVVSQPSSSITIVSDSHTTFSSSPLTTLSVVECLTTSSSVVTSISGQAISAITTTTGMFTYSRSLNYHHAWFLIAVCL